MLESFDMNQLVSELTTFIAKTGIPAITLVICFLLGLFIIKCILKIIRNIMLQSSMDKLLVRFVITIVRIALLVCLILVIFKMMNISTTGFVAAISAVALAIGLSIQDIISGVASGMLIVATHPFKVGDYIESGAIGGTIKEVNLFHTVLNTPDNKRIRVSNKTIFNDALINYSSNELRRLDIAIGIDYSEDQDRVLSTLLATANANPLVLKKPAAAALVSELRTGDVLYTVRVWVKNGDFWTLKFNLQEELLRTLKKNKISVSMPQVTVSYRDDIANVPFKGEIKA